jgi:hypothetical protein
MEQDSPVAQHIKIECTLITACGDFLGFAEDRTHPRVRHIAFEGNASSADLLTVAACQCNRKGVVANASWFGIAVASKRDVVRDTWGLGTTRQMETRNPQHGEQNRAASSVPHHEINFTLATQRDNGRRKSKTIRYEA